MKKYLKIIAIALLFGLIGIQTGCKKDSKEDPKVSITLTLNPLTIASGGTTHFTLIIENLGDAITITKINIKDECISGWAKGQTVNYDLPYPFTNMSFDANESITILDQDIGPVSNSGINDIQIKETIRAYYSGGSASKSVTYTITHASKKVIGKADDAIFVGNQLFK
jgi:hypothetical protein